MDNDELQQRVRDELFWDAKLDSAEIAVSANNGVITLKGTVGSLPQKREAKKAAERVYGVLSVKDELAVRILTGDRHEDADLRGRVLQALMLNSLVPSTIDAQAKHGVVTLTGSANWQYQREEAYTTASNVTGVAEVIDQVRLEVMPKAADVQSSIKKALERNADVDADDLTIETHNGSVSISGTVGSWGEHDEVIAAAWSAPGVTSIDDLMVVRY
ncbi:MAG TPA: BON domain-containing protein [Acidimicrobiales bacterium]|nr:BON domain-containing protein [Acidimicrobiales bacterium]